MMTKRSLGAACLAGLLCVSSVLPACGPRFPEFDDGSPGGAPERIEGGVRFSLHNPKAQRVTIAGDFNGWSSSADPLFDREGNGVWTIVLPLQPGRYEYKFIVDGKKWIPDPKNPERVKDGFGGFNSVVTVGP